MWKMKKAKATASDAKEPDLAGQSVASAIESPAHIGSSEKAATASYATTTHVPSSETAKVATSSDVPSAPQQTTAIRPVDVALGQIVSILLRSPQHKQLPLADLEWLVLPALLSGQYRIVQAQQSEVAVPVGVAVWASVSTAVDQRLSDLSAPLRLSPDEWCAGDIPWLVELVADPIAQQALLKHLGDTVFKDQGIKMRVRDADGKTQIGTFKGAAQIKKEET